MAVMSIILTAPSGAILINTLGTRWLSDDTPLKGEGDGEDGMEGQNDTVIKLSHVERPGEGTTKVEMTKVSPSPAEL